MITDRATLAKFACAAALVLGFTAAPGAAYAQGAAASAAVQSYQELFALSQKEKRGLTFYIRGQTISGIVTKVVGSDAVEVRNQTFGRIVIRIDSIDAIAAN